MGLSTVVGIDPGGRTGLASVELESGRLVTSLTTEDPLVVLAYLEDEKSVSTPLHIAIEDYVGGGYRDKDSINALKLVGLFYYWSLWRQIPVTMQQPQMRRPWVSQAQELVKPEGTVHEVDALAHALRCRYHLLDPTKGKK